MKLFFQLTKFSSCEKIRVKQQIEHLGGEVVEGDKFDSKVSHVICQKPCRSEKFFGALVLGKWILTPQYVEDSFREKKWLREPPYEWSREKEALLKSPGDAGLLDAPRKWRRRVARGLLTPFQGWKAMVSLEKTRAQGLERLLSLGGADILVARLPGTRRAATKLADNLTHVFVDSLKTGLDFLKDEGVLCLKSIYIGDYLTKRNTPNPLDYDITQEGNDATQTARGRRSDILQGSQSVARTNQSSSFKTSSPGTPPHPPAAGILASQSGALEPFRRKERSKVSAQSSPVPFSQSGNAADIKPFASKNVYLKPPTRSRVSIKPFRPGGASSQDSSDDFSPGSQLAQKPSPRAPSIQRRLSTSSSGSQRHQSPAARGLSGSPGETVGARVSPKSEPRDYDVTRLKRSPYFKASLSQSPCVNSKLSQSPCFKSRLSVSQIPSSDRMLTQNAKKSRTERSLTRPSSALAECIAISSSEDFSDGSRMRCRRQTKRVREVSHDGEDHASVAGPSPSKKCMLSQRAITTGSNRRMTVEGEIESSTKGRASPAADLGSAAGTRAGTRSKKRAPALGTIHRIRGEAFVKVEIFNAVRESMDALKPIVVCHRIGAEAAAWSGDTTDEEKTAAGNSLPKLSQLTRELKPRGGATGRSECSQRHTADKALVTALERTPVVISKTEQVTADDRRHGKRTWPALFPDERAARVKRRKKTSDVKTPDTKPVIKVNGENTAAVSVPKESNPMSSQSDSRVSDVPVPTTSGELSGSTSGPKARILGTIQAVSTRRSSKRKSDHHPAVSTDTGRRKSDVKPVVKREKGTSDGYSQSSLFRYFSPKKSTDILDTSDEDAKPSEIVNHAPLVAKEEGCDIKPDDASSVWDHPIVIQPDSCISSSCEVKQELEDSRAAPPTDFPSVVAPDDRFGVSEQMYRSLGYVIDVVYGTPDDTSSIPPVNQDEVVPDGRQCETENGATKVSLCGDDHHGDLASGNLKTKPELAAVEPVAMFSDFENGGEWDHSDYTLSESQRTIGAEREVTDCSSRLGDADGGTTPTGTGVVTADTDIANGDTDVVTGDTDVVTGDTDVVTGDTDVVTGDTDVVTGDTDVVTGDTDVVVDDMEVVSGDTGTDVPTTSRAADIPEHSTSLSGQLQSATKSNRKYTVGHAPRRSPWLPPVRRINLPKSAQTTTAKEPTCFPLPTFLTSFIDMCVEEGRGMKAVNLLLSSVNSVHYPLANTLADMMTKILQRSNSAVQSYKTYAALRHTLDIHPPVNPHLQLNYLQSLQKAGKGEGHHRVEWLFIENVISQALCPDDVTGSELTQLNNVLLLAYLVAIFEKDFKHHLFGRGSSTGPAVLIRSCLLAKTLWPTSMWPQMNPSCEELVVFLLQAVQLENCPQKLQLVRLLHTLVAMVAECLRLSHAGPRNEDCTSLTELPLPASLLARELAFRIHGDLEEAEDIERALGGIELPWLAVIVSKSLLDLYNDALLPNTWDANAVNLTLKTVVARYMYLVPPTVKLRHRKHFSNESPAKLSQPGCHGDRQGTPSKIARQLWSGVPMKSPAKLALSSLAVKKNAIGETPLHSACRRNHVTKVRHLLLHPDVDVNVQDNAGWTPLHEACNHGSIDCVWELLKYKPPRTITSFFKSGSRCEEKKKVDLLARNEDDITPLHDAAANGRLEVASVLLQYGGPVLLEARTLEGHLPIDFASSDEMRELLIRPVALQAANTPRKRLLLDSPFSQSSQLSSQDCTPGEVYMPPSQVYDTALEGGAEAVTSAECAKYILLIHHLLQAYIAHYHLKSLRHHLDNDGGDVIGGDIHAGGDVIRGDVIRGDVIRGDVIGGDIHAGGDVIRGDVIVGGPDAGRTRRDPDHIRKIFREAFAQSCTSEFLSSVVRDLAVLDELKNHVRGFRAHVRKITESRLDLEETHFHQIRVLAT